MSKGVVVAWPSKRRRWLRRWEKFSIFVRIKKIQFRQKIPLFCGWIAVPVITPKYARACEIRCRNIKFKKVFIFLSKTHKLFKLPWVIFSLPFLSTYLCRQNEFWDWFITSIFQLWWLMGSHNTSWLFTPSTTKIKTCSAKKSRLKIEEEEYS